MGLQDLIVTPLYLTIFFAIGIIFRKKISNPVTSKFLLPAFATKIVGAISLGLVYQFYYGGGDTFNYWSNGAWIYKAFHDNVSVGLDLVFGNENSIDAFPYYSQIWLRRSDSAFFIVKMSGLFDLLTFHTYSATSIFFGLICFLGSWEFYTTICKIFPSARRPLYWAVFWPPSVIIWGSGIMKDSITLAATMIFFSMVLKWLILKKRDPIIIGLFLFSSWIIYSIKIYILISLLPVVFIIFYLKYVNEIRSIVAKVLIAPFLITVFLGLGYLTLDYVSSDNERYAIESIPKWTQITAYDLRYWTGKDAGSGYSLGELDGSWQSMITKVFPAIFVTLFRPFPWEVSNPLMALSSLESAISLLFVLNLFFFSFGRFRSLIKDPLFLSILIFVLVFSFAVGISTYNFGSLVRYKIPAIPFFWVVIVLWKNNLALK